MRFFRTGFVDPRRPRPDLLDLVLRAELGAVFVDINSLLCPDGFLSGSYSHDGIHLNWEGYQQIRSVLEKYLPPLVKQ